MKKGKQKSLETRDIAYIINYKKTLTTKFSYKSANVQDIEIKGDTHLKIN